MQIRRNAVIIIRAEERTYNEPRLAIVKSVRKDGSINCTFYMYRNSNIATDYILAAHEVKDRVVGIASDVDPADHRNLACCFPNKDPKDPFIIKQKALDARYPQYAAMRKHYGPYESGEEIRARLRRERELAAA